MRWFLAALAALAAHPGAVPPGPTAAARDSTTGPWLMVLGIAQDAGIPQAGTRDRGFHERVVSLAVVDPDSGGRWLIEATPDFRSQLATLDSVAPPRGPAPDLAGIFLTHAHIGHYTGLMFLGHESIGAHPVVVHATHRMARYLRTNGPWSQLVEFANIDLREMDPGLAVRLDGRLSITPFLVPHRQEYSDVVGFLIAGPSRRVLFIPDIDSWEEWTAAGGSLREQLKGVDLAYVDGSFFADGEIPGRDMSAFPHPRMRHTMDLLSDLPAVERAKIRFIHLNHTNPALDPGGAARAEIRRRGFHVAADGERVGL